MSAQHGATSYKGWHPHAVRRAGNDGTTGYQSLGGRTKRNSTPKLYRSGLFKRVYSWIILHNGIIVGVYFQPINVNFLLKFK
jgi:hypothetical protein